MEGQEFYNLKEQLSESNQIIMMQKLEIWSLKEQIIQMIGEKGDRVADVDDYERDTHPEGFLPWVESKHSNNL